VTGISRSSTYYNKNTDNTNKIIYNNNSTIDICDTCASLVFFDDNGNFFTSSSNNAIVS